MPFLSFRRSPFARSGLPLGLCVLPTAARAMASSPPVPEESNAAAWLLCLLVLVSGLAIFFLYRFQRRLWFANLLIQNRDRERQTVFTFLNELGERITRRIDLDETLELLVDFCMNATRADAGALFLEDKETPGWLQARVVQGLFPPLHETSSDKLISKRKFLAEKIKKERLRVGEGIIGHVFQTAQAVLIPDAKLDPRVPKTAGEVVPLEGLILSPLVVRGSVLGVLVLVNKRAQGQTFNETDRDLVTALSDQAAVLLDTVRLYEELAEKQRMEQELRVAHDFQNLLLPRAMPDIPELDVAGLSQPALEVGGDYFDFLEVDEHHLGVVIGDVSGKGIPGALVMATLRSTMRAEARRDLSPKAVLTRVNEQLLRDTKENVFITVSYGILDRRTGAFRFVRAGHEPLLCCCSPEHRVALHEPNGIVVGLVGGEAFAMTEELEINLRECGVIVLYTDGATEAKNGDDEEYGSERLYEVVRRNSLASPDAVIERMMEDIADFTGGIPQHDDITLVVLRWRGEEGPSGAPAAAGQLAASEPL